MAQARQGRTEGRRGRDGFIVVAVLWILGALAGLAAIYATYVVNTGAAFAMHDDRLQAEALTAASLELTAYHASATPETKLTQGSFGFRAGRAGVTVEFRSEAARIDLNLAPKDLLAGLFRTLGAGQAAAEAYAERIVAWRTPPVPGTTDEEAAAYRAAGLRYAPRRAPFPHPGELALVLGLPDLMLERALRFVTVYSGMAQVNALEAAPEVLAALPGMTPDLLHALLAQRQAAPHNAQAVALLLGPARAYGSAQGGRTLRVTARIAFDNGRRMTSEVVILLLDSGSEPYRVLTWRDEPDEAAP